MNNFLVIGETPLMLHTEFGQTRLVPLVTYTNGRKDEPPRTDWDDVLWVERGEDWYALSHSKTYRVIERDVWLRSEIYANDKQKDCG